jgi:hypothetical protein
MTNTQTDSPEQRAEGLTRNCVDSIRHALEHFSANYGDEYGFHNQKWAILSVAHAAEAFCNLLLISVDHNHPNGRKYPDLGRAINALKARRSPALSKSELHAIKDIFPGIEKQRDELMHRVPQQQLDAEHAALVLLALLYLVRRRVGERADALLDGDTHSVFDELGVGGKDGRLDKGAQQRWFALAAMLAFEDYGPRYLEHCSQCECFTKTPDRGCLACFAD